MSNYPSIILPCGGSILPGQAWTYETVEARLVEAARLWRQAPREGGMMKDVARDGPWRLILPEWGDWGAHEEKPLRIARLTRDEIGRRDEASAWIEAHVGEGDRRIVWLALYDKADGKRPDWARVVRRMGLARGRDGVRMRYRRAVADVAKALNRQRIAVRLALD